MKILVTGATGQLGYDVCRKLKSRGYDNIRGVGSNTLDITDRDAVERYLFEYRPNVIIHNAAYTAVDKAETESHLCWRVNVLGTQNLAEASVRLGVKFVYISTDYVFNGEKSGEYFPDDARDPRSVYGRTKSEGEDLVRTIMNNFFIVRISWVFGINGKNFVKTMLKLAETRDKIDVVCDQIGSPTYTADVASLLVDMIETEKYGVYHATNEGTCSWYEFANEVFRLSGLTHIRVNPVTTEEYLHLVQQQAKRPINSRLNKDKLVLEGFVRLPPWQDALKRFLEEMKNAR